MIAAAIFLTGCATTPAPKPVDDWALKLSPASLGATLQQSQHLTMTYNGQSTELDGLIEVTPTQIQVALIKFGRRILTLRYDGTRLDETKDVMVPAEVNGARILSDLQLVYWPRASIIAQLPSGYELLEKDMRPVDGPLVRILLHNKQTIATVDYGNPRNQKAPITLNNAQFNYIMTIAPQ